MTKAVDGDVEPGICNVVEHNFSINENAEHVKAVYPTLDINHANHNVRMKDMTTALPCRIWAQVPLSNVAFADELVDFKSHLSF